MKQTFVRYLIVHALLNDISVDKSDNECKTRQHLHGGEFNLPVILFKQKLVDLLDDGLSAHKISHFHIQTQIFLCFALTTLSVK